jgi:hypothetical protein
MDRRSFPTLDRMHTSLAIRTNAVLLALYAAALIACIWSAGAHGLAFLAPFSICGAVAGWLQSRVLRAMPQRFISASSALEIRRALWSAREGKLAIVLSWAAGAGCLALLLGEPSGIGFPMGLASYVSFGFARELVTFRSVRDLARANAGGGHAV